MFHRKSFSLKSFKPESWKFDGEQPAEPGTGSGGTYPRRSRPITKPKRKPHRDEDVLLFIL